MCKSSSRRAQLGLASGQYAHDLARPHRRTNLSVDQDPSQNRNRNLEQLVEHLTADKLVTWAWTPGAGRTAVPMPHAEFTAKVKKWQAAGAPCP